MFSRTDEANVHTMAEGGGDKIGTTTDEDGMAVAREASYELVGFLHELPEVGMAWANIDNVDEAISEILSSGRNRAR